jgi:5S rRNA maturation endonuclease (ribonuclease M5)
MAPEIARRHTIDVDSLQRQLTVRQVASYYGFPLPERFGDAGEQRMRCPCQACTGHDDDRSVSINVSDPFRRWKCHRENYGCGAQGNLVALAYCLKHGAMPAGGKPTGKEFYAIAQDLEAIAEGKLLPDFVVWPDHQVRQDVAAVIEGKPNVPLAQSDNENARKLVTLDEELTIQLEDLSAPASAYARRRPFLLSEAIARACHCGYMPGSSKSSLRGQWVFGVQNEQGEPLAWIGRNVRYDDEYGKWLAAGRQGREPMKYRFPNQALFRRGIELYGQEFLKDERFSESLERYGIILVEGFTDRLRLHQLGVLSLAMMSNRMTDEQTDRLAHCAQEYGYNRVGIMHDADAPGDDGAKETLWRMHEQGIDAYLVWSRRKFNGRFANRQPESLTEEEWNEIAKAIDES